MKCSVIININMRELEMKRFTVMAILLAVLAIFFAAGTTGAADFSGKWVLCKQSLDGGALGNVVMDLDEMGMPEAGRQMLIFKDNGKAYLQDGKKESEFFASYKADGNKLTAEKSPELKDYKLVDLVSDSEIITVTLKAEDGTILQFTFRRPK